MAHAAALAAATTPTNRHIRGDTNEVYLRKKATIAVNTGDLIFIEAVVGAAQSAAATYLAFPAAIAKGNTHHYFEQNFVGVAMSGSPSGVTEDIPVATTGIFRFPVTSATGQTCSPGYIVSGASYGAGGASVFSQKVVVGPGLSEGRIGFCVKAEGGATTVDVAILTRFTGTTKGTYAA